MTFPISWVRDQFPSLKIEDDGKPRVYFDNPAGTQTPLIVANAIRDLMLNKCANEGGHFVTSRYTDDLVVRAHEAAATFLGAPSPREVIIGQSASSLNLHMSRSICRDFQPGDEIIVSRMEHEGNIGVWLEIAKDKGLKVKFAPFDEETWQVEPETLKALLTPKTKLLAMNGASNMTGAVNDIATLANIAKDNGTLVLVDAVQLAPHHLIDVQALGVDFLIASAYKFFGPHLGLFWGREEILQNLHPYKGRCVTNELPGRFEAGTPQFELLAGLIATVEYFVELGKELGEEGDARNQIAKAYAASIEYEEEITLNLIQGLQKIKGCKIFGITNSNRMGHRVPTVSFRIEGHKPSDIAAKLAHENIFAWHGHNYAYEPTLQLNIPIDEGVVRTGLAHYNTQAEVEFFIESLEAAL